MNNPESQQEETITNDDKVEFDPQTEQMSEILTYRPVGMTIEEYKLARKIQQQALKKRLKGRCPDRNIARLMPVNYGYNAH